MDGLTLYQGGNTRAILIPEGAGKDRRSRLGAFADWLTSTGRTWHTPDLPAYRDYLLTTPKRNSTEPRKPSAVAAYLSSIRGRYQELVDDPVVIKAFYAMAQEALLAQGIEVTPANIEPLVSGEDGLKTQLERAIDPKRSAVKVEKKQDRTDEEVGLRLTREEASALLASPGLDSLIGLRDTALIAMGLCCGLRESEIVNLEIPDLHATLDGEPAVHVREGKGCKSRVVPYGAGIWARAIVEKWVEAAGIVEGPIFHGFYKGGRRLRKGKLTTRSVQKILDGYPVMVRGELTHVKPHDLRRTYARRLHDEGMPIVGIQQNLGHADHKTTEKYIGLLDVETRRPPSLYVFNLADLDKIEVQAALAA